MINFLILLGCTAVLCYIGCKLGLDKPSIWDDIRHEIFKAELKALEEKKNRPLGV